MEGQPWTVVTYLYRNCTWRLTLSVWTVWSIEEHPWLKFSVPFMYILLIHHFKILSFLWRSRKLRLTTMGDPPPWPCATLYPQKLTLNFADKWRSLSQYSSLADYGPQSLFVCDHFYDSPLPYISLYCDNSCRFSWTCAVLFCHQRTTHIHGKTSL
jgi:hypothetical protein